jgi:plastocyanin
MHPNTRRFGFALIAIVLALAGAAAAALVARAGSTAMRITVSERDYHLTLSRRTYKPGKVTFSVVNRAKIAHSLEVTGRGVTKRLKGTVPPGGHRTLVVTLKGGTYKVFCPLPGHAALGMKTTIRRAGTTGTTTGTTGGTTTGGWG